MSPLCTAKRGLGETPWSQTPLGEPQSQRDTHKQVLQLTHCSRKCRGFRSRTGLAGERASTDGEGGGRWMGQASRRGDTSGVPSGSRRGGLTMQSQSARAAVTKLCRPGGLQATGIDISQLWRLVVQGQGSGNHVLMKMLFLAHSRHLSPVSSHDGRGQGSLWNLVFKSIIPPSRLKQLQKPQGKTPSPLGG